MNINDQIKFKLTKFGKDIMKKSYWGVDLPKTDKEGYYRTSIWEFANIFGCHFHNGQNQIIENNLIIIL